MESRHLDDNIGHTDLSKVTEAIEAAVKRLQSAEKQEKQKLEGEVRYSVTLVVCDFVGLT